MMALTCISVAVMIVTVVLAMLGMASAWSYWAVIGGFGGTALGMCKCPVDFSAWI